MSKGTCCCWDITLIPFLVSDDAAVVRAVACCDSLFWT